MSGENIKEFILPAIAMALGGFLVGRASAPAPDVTEYDGVTQTVQQWGRTVHDRSEARDRVIYRVKLRPDGTVAEREAEHESVRIAEHTDTSTGAVATGSEVHAKTVTAARSKGRVDLLAGATLRTDPLAASWLFGAHAAARLADSPFFVGGLALVRPAPFEFSLLLSVGLEFQ